MRSSALVRVGIMLLLSSSASAQGKLPRPTAGTGLHHVVNSFEFEIDAPLARAAPLFGPEGERKWAGKTWDPKFIYPTQPRDVEGAVFTVKQAGRNPLWINTVFDLADAECSTSPPLRGRWSRSSTFDSSRRVSKLERGLPTRALPCRQIRQRTLCFLAARTLAAGPNGKQLLRPR
jgi:hypothetical protein